jgi:hypothetical protein
MMSDCGGSEIFRNIGNKLQIKMTPQPIRLSRIIFLLFFIFLTRPVDFFDVCFLMEVE